MKALQNYLEIFLNSKNYNFFEYYAHNNLDKNISCFGLNIKRDKIISIKKYLSFTNSPNLTPFLKLPFSKSLLKNKDTDPTTISSPSIALKYYPENNIFRNYFHIKFNRTTIDKNKNYFTPSNHLLKDCTVKKAGISIENNKIIKYFYFNTDSYLLTILGKKFNFNNLCIPKKIEYVEYKSKNKFIIDENTSPCILNDNKVLSIIEYIDKTLNMKYKTCGKDSEGVISLYFF